MREGIRVVRGPDWNRGDDDSGEGFVGTVLEFKNVDKMVLVQWDTGGRARYRIGYEGAYDLRVYDFPHRAHLYHNCRACGMETVDGIRWECAICEEFILCNLCYMADKHDLEHPFSCILGLDLERVNVPERSGDVKVQAMGIFPRAWVIKRHDLEWSDSNERMLYCGVVIKLQGNRVAWQVGRLRFDDIVDLRCVLAEKGGSYYKTHLPVLTDNILNTDEESDEEEFRTFEMKGMRVVRGPDWNRGEEDSGEGHLGTIVETGNPMKKNLPDKTVLVQWDTGVRASYRIGLEYAYDLRVYDAGPTGSKHHGIECAGCKVKNIAGIRWICNSCHDVSLCHTCYAPDKHDATHKFTPLLTAATIGVMATERCEAERVYAKGIFPGAIVTRGPNWENGEMYGREGHKGQILKSGCYATVQWRIGRTGMHRLGSRGNVDLKCVEAADGASYYKDHLPVLGMEISVGDRVGVKLNAELLKTVLKNHERFNHGMFQRCGIVGYVNRITYEGDVMVHLYCTAIVWKCFPNELTKLEFSTAYHCETTDDLAQANELSRRISEWRDPNIDFKISKEELSFSSRRWASDTNLNTDRIHSATYPIESADIDEATLRRLPTSLCHALVHNDEASSLRLINHSSIQYFISKKVDRKYLPLCSVPGKREYVSPLFIAIIHASFKMMVRMIDAGASLGKLSDCGDYPLHAVCFSHVDTITKVCFLGRHCDGSINATNKHKRTALMTASQGGYRDIVELLLHHNAAIRVKDHDHKTALLIAKEKERKDIADAIAYAHLRRVRDNRDPNMLLKDLDADPDLLRYWCTEAGQSPLKQVIISSADDLSCMFATYLHKNNNTAALIDCLTVMGQCSDLTTESSEIDTGARLLQCLMKSDASILADCIDTHPRLMENVTVSTAKNLRWCDDIFNEKQIHQLAECFLQHKGSLIYRESILNEWDQCLNVIPSALFHHACTTETSEIVDSMVKGGADPFSLDGEGVTAMVKAVLSDVEPRLKLFSLQNSDKIKSKTGGQQARILRDLLAMEAGSQTHSLARWATFNMKCPKTISELISDLLQDTINLNEPYSTLAAAVSTLPAPIIEELIKQKANVNSHYEDGETSLHAAVRVNSAEKLKMIADVNGADLSIQWNDLTALETAVLYYPNGNITRRLGDFIKKLSSDQIRSLARNCKFRCETDATFAVRTGCKELVEKFVTEENMTSFPKDNDKLPVSDSTWYEKVKNSETYFDPKTEKKKPSDAELKNFLCQSILFSDDRLAPASLSFSEKLLLFMTECSDELSKSTDYSFLEFSPSLTGSMCEGTKTFVPNESDLTCVVNDVKGLEIVKPENSQSMIRVNDSADKRWVKLCLAENILCPQRMSSTFTGALKGAMKIVASKFPEPFFFSEHSVQKKDKVPCFHFLVRDDTINDLVVSVDFVCGIPHPDYLPEDSLPLSKQDTEDKCKMFLIPKVSQRKSVTEKNAHFLVSYTSMEARFVKALPENIRIGFIYAKAARNEHLCSLPAELSKRVLEPMDVTEFVTTYMLKTCLMFAFTEEEYDLFGNNLHTILDGSSSYECAYVLYVMLHWEVKERGKLPFFFDRSVNLVHCAHDFDLAYDENLGCCLKRALIVGFCECIMESLGRLVRNPSDLRDNVEERCECIFDTPDNAFSLTFESDDEYTPSFSSD